MSALRRLPIAFCLVSAALFLPACVGHVHLESETRELRVEHLPSSALDIRTANGRVEVIADPAASDVRIIADLRAQTLERLEQTAVTTTRDDRGVLHIGVEWADGKRLNSEGCSFDVRIPDAAGVSVETGNGAIRLDALAGNAVVRTSNGKIEVSRQGGSVEARTSNGSITITAPGGPVTADTSNGAIHITGAPRDVRADTSNGRIEISLTPDNPGPVRADSSNGRIELSVGRGFLGRITMRTSSSRISADERLVSGTSMRSIQIRNNRGTIDFAEGGSESSLTTSNGAIDVRTLPQ